MIKGFYAILNLGTNKKYQDLLEDFWFGGGRISQLRGKNVAKDEIRIIAKDISHFKKTHPFTFIINDHPDIVEEVLADGVHVGDNDPTPEEIRKVYGREMLIGKSTHSLDEIKIYSNGEADYLAFGAIYKSPSKGHDHPVQGIERLKEAVCLCDKKPLVAIGGIDKTNIDNVVSTGVSSVAMISSWCNADYVKEEVKWWVNKLNQNI